VASPARAPIASARIAISKSGATSGGTLNATMTLVAIMPIQTASSSERP
jgi:hypothetical protein